MDQLSDVARMLTWCALLYGWSEYLDGQYPQADTTAPRHEPSGLRNRDGHRRRCRVGHVLTIAALRYLPAFQLSQRDIAGEHVSLNTVKTHCQANYHKLGVGDRTSAIQAARDARLL